MSFTLCVIRKQDRYEVSRATDIAADLVEWHETKIREWYPPKTHEILVVPYKPEHDADPRGIFELQREAERRDREKLQAPLDEGPFTVTLTAVDPSRETEVEKFVGDLPGFRTALFNDLESLVQRVQHIAPEVIAEDISQAEAIRLKVGFEERGGRVKITERVTRAGTGRRETIPESVRREVWRRDGGACVKCGSRVRLEFDHMVPVSKGGSNTARNIELLCQDCNRQKAAKI